MKKKKKNVEHRKKQATLIKIYFNLHSLTMRVGFNLQELTHRYRIAEA